MAGLAARREVMRGLATEHPGIMFKWNMIRAGPRNRKLETCYYIVIIILITELGGA